MLPTGKVLQDRYRVVKLLAQGGFGSVYRAWDTRLNMPVALKESLDTSPLTTRQFSQEAKLLSNLNHPNLPRVLDFFTIPNQGLYLVMEFVQGQDLEERLAAAGGPIPEAQALHWMTQVCDALTYLHTRTPPTIHRDVKPANIRITPEGQAYLVDFGIAKQYDPSARTMTGARAVTPGYAPFEQYGQRSTDARTDIYALGATVYHLLTGQRPPESLERVASDQLIPPRQLNPNIHPGIEAAILRAMQVIPEQRYQRVADFKKALLNPVEAGVQVKAPVQQPVMATVKAATPPPAYAAPVAPPISKPADRPAARPAVRQTAQAQPSRSKWRLAGSGAGVLLLLAVIAVGVAYLGLGRRSNLVSSQTASAETHEALASLPSETPLPTPVMPTATPTREPSSTALPSATLLPTDTPAPSLTPVATVYMSPTPVLPEGIILDAQSVMMRLISAGNFWMGDDGDAWSSRPMRSVSLDAYYIDIYEVTNAAYAKCVNAGGCTVPLRTKSNTRMAYYGDAGFDNFPVVQVNWSMAQQYCQWRGARLPTEAEWEKAARGDSDQRTYPWLEATVINCMLTNYKSCALEDTDAVDSHPDGVSPYGLFNMAGNVREWVADWYSLEYYRSAPASNPKGPASGRNRVTRGGSWQDTSNFLRVYYRFEEPPATYSYWIGFRCVRPLQ